MPASLFNFHVKQKTNEMIRLSDIQDALLHLVGWEQSYVPGDYLSDLTESESGLKFQDAHPLCTLDNIKAIIGTAIIRSNIRAVGSLTTSLLTILQNLQKTASPKWFKIG